MNHTDQIGTKIELSDHPRRIISLVPSQTELLYSLGLEDEVVGITKFCVHPELWFKTKKKIGGTKNPNLSEITSLQPDLIIANKEENRKEDIDILEKFCPVWTSNIHNFNDALEMIGHIGLITGKKESAKNIISEIHEKFNQVKSPRQYRVAYLIWKNPCMSVGKDTFIHSILHKAGFINVFDNHIRYPEISEDMLLDCCADFVFLSSEPYPFKKKHITEIKAILSKKNPNTKVLLVDGESFSWYGSRLLTSADYLNDLINSL